MLARTRFGAGDEQAAKSLHCQAGEIPDELCGGYTMPLLTMAVDLSVACGFEMRHEAAQEQKWILLVLRGELQAELET